MTYDKDYQTENLFGKPYKELIEFFSSQQRGTILDVGCGQGRDSLALANLGFDVTSIDESKVGIDQMMAAAEKSDLKIEGSVENMFEFEPNGKYDYILMDSVTWFEKKDKDKETGLIRKMMEHVVRGGKICIFVHKGKEREDHLKGIFGSGWKFLEEKYVDHRTENGEAEFFMLVAENEGDKSPVSRLFNKILLTAVMAGVAAFLLEFFLVEDACGYSRFACIVPAIPIMIIIGIWFPRKGPVQDHPSVKRRLGENDQRYLFRVHVKESFKIRVMILMALVAVLLIYGIFFY